VKKTNNTAPKFPIENPYRLALGCFNHRGVMDIKVVAVKKLVVGSQAAGCGSGPCLLTAVDS